MPPNTTHAPRARASRPTSYPRQALPVWMPIPTMSPASIANGSSISSVSSVITGSPNREGVAAARTYSHRGVITPTPKARWLGLIRCTRTKWSPRWTAALTPALTVSQLGLIRINTIRCSARERPSLLFGNPFTCRAAAFRGGFQRGSRRTWRKLARLREPPAAGARPGRAVQAADRFEIRFVRRPGRDDAGGIECARAARGVSRPNRERRQRTPHSRGADAVQRRHVRGDRARGGEPLRDHSRRRIDRRADGPLAPR